MLQNINFLSFLISTCVYCFGVQAQQTPQFSFSHNIAPELYVDNQALINPWGGGINTAQISTIDLNLDGRDDLVVFDKTLGRLSTYLAEDRNNTTLYVHAPEYELAFPQFIGWVLLRDYNQDGKKDIFAHTNFGIKVYQNISDQKSLKWKLIADPINTQGFSGKVNLQVNIIDIPAIVDLDEDGDLDIVTFDFASGSYLEYHQNLSIEKYGNVDHLEFKKITNCWGGLFEGVACGEFSFDNFCDIPGRSGGGGGSLDDRIKHIGSTITILDLNGDQQKDLLVGDISCSQIFRLDNIKSSVKAQFAGYDTLFPKSKPINFAVFPAVFWEDLDFDGVKDLLASPNVFVNEYDQIDFSQSMWFYKNVGTDTKPEFQFQQSDFLQNSILDLGEDAYPTLADYDGDGDQDLFVGNRGTKRAGGFSSGIALFENIGGVDTPKFQLKTWDYLELSNLGLLDIKPKFQDINGDQSLDLCFSAGEGRKIAYYSVPNQAVQSKEFQFNLSQIKQISIPIQRGDTPLFFDIDGDQDLDLLLGRKSGSLSFFENQGTTIKPDFQLVTDTLLGIKRNSLKRSLVPVITDLNGDQKPDLLTSDSSGEILFYDDFLNPNKKAEARKSLFYNLNDEGFGSFYFGRNCFPTVSDLDGDQLPELIVGTHAGGLMYLKNITGQANSTSTSEAFSSLKITPNSSDKSLKVYADIPLQIEIYPLGVDNLLKKVFIRPKAETLVDLKAFSGQSFQLKISDAAGEILERRVDF